MTILLDLKIKIQPRLFSLIIRLICRRMTPFFQRWGLAALYLFLGIGIAGYLNSLLWRYPLTDFAVTDIDWTREWLIMTVIDYYGVVAALSLITLLAEPFPYGLIWVIGYCLLGSPICCFYIVFRIATKSVVLREAGGIYPKLDPNEE